jgi:hypothetical protein
MAVAFAWPNQRMHADVINSVFIEIVLCTVKSSISGGSMGAGDAQGRWAANVGGWRDGTYNRVSGRPMDCDL